MTTRPPVYAVSESDAAAGLSCEILFTILWEELSDLLGSAATAALLRRAAHRAARRSRELAELTELTISRVDGEYGFAVPQSFGRTRGPSPALRALLDELRPLLQEATGDVVLRQLARRTALHGWEPAAHPPQ